MRSGLSLSPSKTSNEKSSWRHSAIFLTSEGVKTAVSRSQTQLVRERRSNMPLRLNWPWHLEKKLFCLIENSSFVYDTTLPSEIWKNEMMSPRCKSDDFCYFFSSTCQLQNISCHRYFFKWFFLVHGDVLWMTPNPKFGDIKTMIWWLWGRWFFSKFPNFSDVAKDEK